MNDNEKDGITTIHLFYLGGLLVEAIRNFHSDLTINCRFASDVISRATYLRLNELCDKFEQAALLSAQTNFSP